MKKINTKIFTFIFILISFCGLSCKQNENNSSPENSYNPNAPLDDPKTLSDLIDPAICSPYGNITALGKYFYIYDCSNIEQGIINVKSCSKYQGGNADAYVSIVAGKGNVLFENFRSPEEKITLPIMIHRYSLDMEHNFTELCHEVGD